MLQVIMQHRDHFVDSHVTLRAGSIQVTAPTEQETLAAGACMRHAYECFGLTFAHISRSWARIGHALAGRHQKPTFTFENEPCHFRLRNPRVPPDT